MFALAPASSATIWKSPSSRSSLQLMPSTQIGPDFTAVGSAETSAENVAPPSRLSVYFRNHCAEPDRLLGLPLADEWYSETATFEPSASTHGNTEVPVLTIARGALHVLP